MWAKKEMGEGKGLVYWCQCAMDHWVVISKRLTVFDYKMGNVHLKLL
jgi:hypothetical protein